MADLLPCPFCAMPLRRSSNRDLWWHPGVITDSDCPLSGRGIPPFQIDAWNRRTTCPTIGAGDGELREALERINDYSERSDVSLRARLAVIQRFAQAALGNKGE